MHRIDSSSGLLLGESSIVDIIVVRSLFHVLEKWTLVLSRTFLCNLNYAFLS